MNHTIKRVGYLISACVLILSPWILLLFIIQIYGGSLGNSHPIWPDELSYWHEILSFATKGFDFGYYTIDEILPRYLSFGSHGFGTISIYTLYAFLFGWDYNSLVIANNLYISISFLLLILLIKPDTKKMLLIAVFYLTYMPLILYSSTSMSELMHHALMIAYFTLLFLFLKTDSNKKILLIILFVFCIYLSFIRIIYIVLFLPILFGNKKNLDFNSDLFKTLAIWLGLSGILYFANSLFNAPYPFSFLATLFASSSIVELIVVFTEHFVENLTSFVALFDSNFLYVFSRYFILFILLKLLWNSNILKYKQTKLEIPYFISFLILFLFILINIAAYDVFEWRDYRVITPLVFGIIIFITLIKENLTIKISIIANLLVLCLFAIGFPSLKAAFFDQNRYQKVEKTNNDLKLISYTTEYKSKFENTIILTSFDPNEILNIPPGIGLTFFFGEITDTLNSKYIYSQNIYPLKTYKIISSSEKGVLYQKIE